MNAPAMAFSKPSSEYLIQDIMPAREVHLIGGPLGAGKTTLMFEIMDQWAQGKDVFGYASYPQPFCYVACDRSLESTNRTIARCNIKINPPRFSLIDVDIPSDITAILKEARRRVKDLRVLFLDAIAVICPGGKINDYGVVSSMLKKLTTQCQRENVTIIGLGHATKTRENETIKDPRQRFLGSVAWGGFSDTMIFIDPAAPEDPSDTRRVVNLLPRNASGEHLMYQFDKQGRLVPVQIGDEEFLPEEQFAMDIEQFDAGQVVETAALLALGYKYNMSTTKIERTLRRMVSKGTLDRPKKGVYRRPWTT